MLVLRKVDQVIVEAPTITTLDDVMQMFRSASGLQNILAEDGDEQEQEDPDCDEQEEEERSDDDAFARRRLLNFAGAAADGGRCESFLAGWCEGFFAKA